MASNEAKDLNIKIEALEERVEALEADAQKEPKPVGEAPAKADSETFMYSKKEPKGKKFKTSEVGKLGSDWVDSPAKLK